MASSDISRERCIHTFVHSLSNLVVSFDDVVRRESGEPKTCVQCGERTTSVYTHTLQFPLTSVHVTGAFIHWCPVCRDTAREHLGQFHAALVDKEPEKYIRTYYKLTSEREGVAISVEGGATIVNIFRCFTLVYNKPFPRP